MNNFGELVNKLSGSDYAYKINISRVEEKERKGDATSVYDRIQAAALRFQPSLEEWPKIDELEGICYSKFGSGLTGQNLKIAR